MAAHGDAVLLVEELANALERLDLLAKLKTILAGYTRAELTDFATTVPISGLFDCLNSSSREQLDVTCGILDVVLRSRKPRDVLDQFGVELQRGLQHPDKIVKQLCLSQMERLTALDADVLIANVSILQCLIDLLSAEDASLHKSAHSTLVTIGSTRTGSHAMFGSTTSLLQRHFMKALCECNSVIWFRLMQVVVDVSKSSEAALAFCISGGTLQGLVAAMDRYVADGDVLSQLCMVDLLGDLALTDHGYEYLHQLGTMTAFYNALIHASGNKDESTALLRPGLLKLFGGVARLKPKIVLESYHEFYVIVCSGVSCTSDTLWKELSVETLGFVGEPADNKPVLARLGVVLLNAIRQLGHQLTSGGSSDTKSKVIWALAQLLYVKVEEQSEELLSLTQSWYGELSGSDERPALLSRILKMSRQPFAEVRFAVHRLYSSLALLPWAQRLMRDEPTFCEYLLDRSSEREKEGKELKYEVVRNLVGSPSAADVFDTSYLQRLRQYEREGPFYIRPQSEVVTEDV